MSFLYGANNNYMRVDSATFSLSAFSVILSFINTSTPGNYPWLMRIVGPGTFLVFTDADNSDFKCFVDRATTGSTAESTGLTLTTNQQYTLAMTYSESNGCTLYWGTPTANLAEPSYASQVTGSGATTGASGSDIYIGNRDNNDARRLYGDLSSFMLIRRELTLSELISLQHRPRFVEDTELFLLPGFHGASACPDLSGNDHSITINGLTVGSNAYPYPPLFGYDPVHTPSPEAAPSNIPMFKVNSGLVNAGLVNRGLVA